MTTASAVKPSPTNGWASAMPPGRTRTGSGGLSSKNKGEGRKTNGYLVFAIVNVAIILGLVVVSVIDLLTAAGFMAGIFGTVGLVYGVPIFCIPLAIDILLYFIYGRKKN